MVDVRERPLFETRRYNDPAIAVDIEVEDIITAPYDGYLIGVCVKGAGIEGAIVSTSDGMPKQAIPGKDIAVDTDTTTMQGDGAGKIPSDYVIFNQAISKNTKLSYTPFGTGTAEANLYALFSPQPLPNEPYTLNLSVSVDYSGVALDDKIIDCPTFLDTLARIFMRGAGLQEAEIRFGQGGNTTFVQGRAIAVNTDAVPHVYRPIFVIIPDKVFFVQQAGGTGAVRHYFQFTGTQPSQ